MRKHSLKYSLNLLSAFSTALGWINLSINMHKEKDKSNKYIVWFHAHAPRKAGNLCLQINEFPIGQDSVYEVCVFAYCYRICSGWHVFKARNKVEAIHEAKRLSSWMHFEHFNSLKFRNAYRATHPACASYSANKNTKIWSTEYRSKKKQDIGNGLDQLTM